MADDQFLIMWPCFTIKNKEGTGGVVIPLEDGTNACVILTDEALLEEFRERYQFTGETVQFDYHLELLKYLKKLPPAISHVAFDPGKVSFANYPIDKFKAFLWKAAKEDVGEE